MLNLCKVNKVVIPNDGLYWIDFTDNSSIIGEIVTAKITHG